MTVQPHAQPFAADQGRVGVVLSHGFTGSPASMRPWGEFLAEHGFSVRVPRLPGHGTTWQELNRTGWQEWYAQLEAAFDDLLRRCDQVVVGGLSMGGCLALRLAQQRGRDVAAVILVNPAVTSENKQLRAVPVLKHLVASRPGIGNDIKKPGVDEHCYPRVPLKALHAMMRMWAVTREDLPKVTQPLLMFRSAEDHVVEPLSGRIISQRVSSRDLDEHLLGNSYHVATLDHDAPAIFEESLKFVRRVTEDSPDSGPGQA
ncbi:MAG: alpha/beta fold hydrolase [Actinomycetota bacterium]|nr:alpha/beta fold hydrolase [Actinomycetota bacterium]